MIAHEISSTKTGYNPNPSLFIVFYHDANPLKTFDNQTSIVPYLRVKYRNKRILENYVVLHRFSKNEKKTCDRIMERTHLSQADKN